MRRVLIAFPQYRQFKGGSDKQVKKNSGRQMDGKIDHMIAEYMLATDIPVQGKTEI